MVTLDRLAVSPRARDALAAALILVLSILNAVLLPRSITVILEGGPAVDWLQFVEGGRRVFANDLYETTNTYGYRYSPVAAYGFVLLEPIGTEGWRLLHVVAALALPTWPMRLVTLAAWPFWYDVEAGNLMVFVLLAAAWAFRRNPVGTFGFLAMALLFPRPLMLPLVAWILWQQPAWRIPAAVMAAAHLGLAITSGWLIEWVALLTTLGGEQASPNNLGPTRLLGAWWFVVGIPLAAVLTWRHRLGWASLAISYPYVLPYYLIMAVMELPDRFGRDRATGPGSVRS
ncbi:MAG: hypothetical protein ACR2I5_03785 [Candidatus Limnocylindria bacterium]